MRWKALAGLVAAFGCGARSGLEGDSVDASRTIDCAVSDAPDPAALSGYTLWCPGRWYTALLGLRPPMFGRFGDDGDVLELSLFPAPDLPIGTPIELGVYGSAYGDHWFVRVIVLDGRPVRGAEVVNGTLVLTELSFTVAAGCVNVVLSDGRSRTWHFRTDPRSSFGSCS